MAVLIGASSDFELNEIMEQLEKLKQFLKKGDHELINILNGSSTTYRKPTKLPGNLIQDDRIQITWSSTSMIALEKDGANKYLQTMRAQSKTLE